jgi:hypothetical protein
VCSSVARVPARKTLRTKWSSRQPFKLENLAGSSPVKVTARVPCVQEVPVSSLMGGTSFSSDLRRKNAKLGRLGRFLYR